MDDWNTTQIGIGGVILVASLIMLSWKSLKAKVTAWIPRVRSKSSNRKAVPVSANPNSATSDYIQAVLTALEGADDSLKVECLAAGLSVHQAVQRHRKELLHQARRI